MSQNTVAIRTVCEQLLAKQYIQDLWQKGNISALMSNSRWANKQTCFMAFDNSLTNVQSFLKNVQNNQEKYDVLLTQEITGQEVLKQEISAPVMFWSAITSWTNTVLGNIGLMLLLLLISALAFNVIKQGLRYLYSLFNFRRYVFLKVILPRGDGKSDREQAKELAKDMKEKIGRMSQVYVNLHKISELSTSETLMFKVFAKQKMILIYQYENWLLNFIVGTLPEYQKIVEGAISSQFSDCSIEQTARPKFFTKKYSDITAMESKKNPVYTIKMYKLLPDDPINNLIDAMTKVSRYDTVSIVMPIKPESSKFNEKMKKAADRLYKNLDIGFTKRWEFLLMPRKIFWFLFSGPTEKMLTNKKEEDRVTMVRMVKAKEDAMNAIWEEAWQAAFRTGMYVITSSDEKANLEKNMDSIISAYNIYTDEYSNELNESNVKHDVFWFLFKPLRRIGVALYLVRFFFKTNYFTTNALTSLFHFPDGTYNRSPAIDWMQYKILAAPTDLPIMKPEDFNGYIMSWTLAEHYKDGKLSKILEEYPKHWAVGTKVTNEEKHIPIEEYTTKQLKGKEIIEENGKKFVKEISEKKINGYKLFKNGVLLWTNIYRNNLSPVYMKRNDRTRHHYCVGKSGTWKSVFLQTIARQDIWNGDGICLIDPHGDLAEDILAYIPKERAKDVVYFDAGNEDRPMWLNLYEINILDEADRVVNDATEIFLKMFGPEIFGPRLQEYFKYGSLTLLEDFEDRPTLLDVVRLFTDETYREYKLKKVTNPTVKNRWEKTFNAMGDREKQEIIPYFSAKFVSFNTNRLIRNIIGQTKSWFKFEDIMDNGKILIINLSKGKIGELNAQLLGMIIVSKIYTAAMARARIDESKRRDFYLYVDEFQNFVSGTFADILSEARKYKLSLIMAHQYIAQLDPPKWLWGDQWGKGDVKAAVFGNVGTMQSFKVGAPDAEFLEKEYAPVLSSQDIVGIANYKAYLKLNIDNATTRVFSVNMIYTNDYQNKKIVPILKEYSAKKYGRKREFVDAEMAARLGIGIDETTLPETPAPTEAQAPAPEPTQAPAPEPIQAPTPPQEQTT